MKRNLLLLIISLIFYNVSFSQQFTTRTLDTTANVFSFSPQEAIRISKAERQSNSRYKTPPKYDKTMMKSLQNVTSRMPSSDVDIPYLNQTPPSDMTDKYVLKPSPGNLSKGLPSLAEDLHNGKVNVNIPFFEFEYFDYKIPVSINNRYPQVIEGSHNEPTFYINSNVGGDWTLSIDQFKVSRQINGVEDEHPTKGYFSSFSQSKIYNPETISDEDIHNGLKGNWDPAIDIYHYSTPTVSGSFLLNLPNGEYEILSGEKVHIEFDLVNNELREFTIKDNGGHKYIFGGDSSSIEVSQSISDVFSFGMFTDANYNKKTVTHIIEVDYDNALISAGSAGIDANLFVYNDHPSPIIPPTVEEVFQSIQQHDSIDSIKDFLTLVGSEGVGYNRREYYAVIDFYADQNVSSLKDGDIYNDPEMRRHKVNTGWYLKEIVLPNSKKINLMYYNTIWQAYQTFSSNKMKINMITSGNDYPFHYIKPDGTVVSLYNLDIYACFPEQLTFMQFPINETHTVTTNFIKSPVLLKIYDEDDFSTVNLSYFNYKPYVRKPDIFPNAPAETLNNNDSSNNYGLLKKITFTKSGSQQNEVIFNNHTEFGYFNDQGTTYSEPHGDRSYLSSCIVNGIRKYNFDYDGSRLKRIHYPTGGTKEFFSTPTNSNHTRSYYNLGNGSNSPGYYYGLHEARVDSIMTTSENNSMTEKFVYKNRSYSIGAYSTKKTYRPDIASCTSGARLYSTSPVFNSHSTKSGSAYLNVEKYINNELQFSSEFSDKEYTGNTLRLTNESIPGYLSTIGRPATYLDEKKGYLNQHIIYKTNTYGASEAVKRTTYTRAFTGPDSGFPSVYLTKIEAGPWQNTSGAIKRAYSTYLRTYENNLSLEQRFERNYFDTGESNTKLSTYFKRTRIPELGLNSLRPYKTEFYDFFWDVYHTYFYSPIEIEGLTSSNSSVNVQNSVFRDLLSNNRVPNLETVSLHIGKLIHATSRKFKLTPTNASGESFAVVEKEKQLELQSTDLTLSDFATQSIASNNPENLIFDPSLKDNVQYDKYDEDGRVLEFHSLDNGIYTSIIWGYKKQFPVAVLKNARYSEIQNFVSTIQNYSNINTSSSMSSLISELNNLRTLMTNSQVTTYVYKDGKPSIITDARGNTLYYEYDNLNRLIYVKDRNNNILSENEYNYKN